jgi:death-on-curing protein
MNNGGCSMNSPINELNQPPVAPIVYLTASDLYNLNVEVTDGNTLVRDLNLLNSAAARPKLALFGEAQFPTLLDKAAALLHSLAYHHLFIDGNKRSAVRAVTYFLALNGYDITWQYETEYHFVLEIAQGQHEVPEIAGWLAGYIQPFTA